MFIANLVPRSLLSLSGGSLKNSCVKHGAGQLIAMKPTQAAALLLLLTCVDVRARAGDWTFCIAPDDASRRIYMSQPFPSKDARPEGRFDELLVQRQLRHDSVQCPRADDEDAASSMRQHSVEVNRSWGRQVIDTPWAVPP